MLEVMRNLLFIQSGLVPNECRLFTSATQATLDNTTHKEYAIFDASLHSSTNHIC